jgi:hypothetical protein
MCSAAVVKLNGKIEFFLKVLFQHGNNTRASVLCLCDAKPLTYDDQVLWCMPHFAFWFHIFECGTGICDSTLAHGMLKVSIICKNYYVVKFVLPSKLSL